MNRRLTAFCCALFSVFCLFSEETKSTEASSQGGFTINYNTVSMIEYVRFASKICNINFIFDEADLDFTVTIVSDAPITPENVMATLIQTLRIHGLSLLEQENNLVIHKAPDVSQIATIVTDSLEGKKPPIVTRILRINNANVDSIAGIIRPMISTSALLETSPETHQLILTDVTANVDKVATLIEILDSPHNQLMVRTYVAQHNSPEHLVDLCSQIMTPIAQGNPFILVPQPLANSIFIVSSNDLIEKTLTVLTSLDVPPQKEVITQRRLKGENIFVYTAVHRSSDELLKNLMSLAENLQKTGIPEGDLIHTMEAAQAMKETNSITFIGSKDSIAKVKEFLSALDVPSTETPIKSSFFVYRPQNRGAKEIDASLQEVANNLKGTAGASEGLVEMLSNAKVNVTTNTILFSGDESLFPRIKEILATIDTPVPGKKAAIVMRNDFFIYKVQHAEYEDLASSLKNFAKNLDKSNISDEGVVEAIDGMKPIPETNSILFTGSETALKRLQEIVPSFDAGMAAMPISNQFFIYKAKYQKGETLSQSIHEITKDLRADAFHDPAFLRTLESMKYVKNTNSFLFTGDAASLKRLEDLIASLDVPAGVKVVEKNIWLYPPQYAPREKIELYLKQVTSSLDKGSDKELIETLRSVKWIDSSQSFLFQGSNSALTRVKELLQNIDHPSQSSQKNFSLVSLQYVSESQVNQYFDQLEDQLNKKTGNNQDLIETIHSRKWIEDSHSFLFNGSPSSLDRIKELLINFDKPSSAAVKPGYFIYKLQSAPGELIEEKLDTVAKNLNESGLKDDKIPSVIANMRYIKETNSLLLTGDPAAIEQVKTMIAEYDKPGPAIAKQGYFIYKLQSAPGDRVEKELDSLAKDLKESGLKDDKVLSVIANMRYIKETNSLLLTGDSAAIDEVKTMIAEYDKPGPAIAKQGYFIYKLQSTPGELIEEKLDTVAKNLKESGLKDDKIPSVIANMRYIKETNSLLLTGDPAAIEQVKTMIAEYDKPGPAIAKQGYFIYKLQSAPGDMVEEELDSLAKDLKESGLKDDKVLSVIANMRYIKETNSLLLTGDPAAIDEVKAMIAEYDYPRTVPGSASSNFFLYKPQHQSADQIEKSLHDIASNLKKAGLADPSLLNTIDTAKYVETTNSLIFTGNSDSIQKIQVLLKDIDIPAKEQPPIQHIGKTTFLLYKLKIANGLQITNSIKAMTIDLKKAGNADADFLSALETMKYVKETNSLFFTGTEPALQQVQTLVQQLDTQALAAQPAAPEKPLTTAASGNFYLYKPVSLSASDLEKLLRDFEENVKSSGLNDPDLFAAIDSMRSIAATQSLVFTGTPKALDQIKELLKTFDIPANLTGKPITAPLEPSIQAVDNTSFLVYKLQFHKGDEIQSALKQIAKDLIQNNAPINQNLLNSINSIQWLDVTNSLLCSGDQETLTRLKELIKNLDIPLKQVFIEILVIETTLTNALQFGLEWGGNYKFKNKFGGSIFNTIPQPNLQTAFPDKFVSSVSGLTPPSAPTPVGNIPPVSGFDLGVIGEVIKHNGNTFLTLGSLLSALQSDTETTIITAPKLLGQDGRTSSIFSGANIPFTGSFVNNTTTGATILTSNIEYRDIGLNLTITPVLGNSDIVTLDINLDRSQTATDITNQSQLNFQSQTANGIITSKTTMQTTVHVPDRNFLVLSGFVNNSNTKTKQGIPCLGGLPLIGAAFSQQNDTISTQNVVIFMRPFIINSVEDMRRVTSEQEDFFRDLAGTPFLEHNYGEAMELIKSIDDE